MWRLCAGLALLAAPCAAQTTVGARLGATYSAPVDAEDGISGRAGLGLVVFAERALRPGLALGAEGGVLTGGFVQEVTPAQTTGAPGTLRARVVVLTLAPTAMLGVGGALRPELFFGPRLDLRVAESATLNGQSGFLNEYAEAMLGASLGVGVRVPAGARALRLDARVSRMRVTSARSELQGELRVGLAL